MAEKDLEVEVEELTQRLKVMEEEMLGRTASTSTTKQAVNSRAKPDVYKDGPWEEWVTHFQLCAEINQWDEEQCCQQLVFEGPSSDGLCHPWYGREVKLQHITGSLKQKNDTATRKSRPQVGVSSEKTRKRRNPRGFSD